MAWADSSDANAQARIELKPAAAGAGVTPSGFDLGADPNLTRNSTVNICAIGGGPALDSVVGPIGSAGTAPTHFLLSISSATGLWIEWRDGAFNNGIDHIQYTVGAVPEPHSVGLLLAGLAAVSFAALRRR